MSQDARRGSSRRRREEAADAEPWLPAGLPVHGLAWVAVLLAYAAALAAVAGGATTMSLSSIYNLDTVRPWLFYRGLFHDAPWSLGGWNIVNSTFALDLVLNWLMFTVGAVFGSASRAQFLFGLLVTPLAWTCVSALGWVMVCRLAWGRSPAREAAMVLMHALPFACFAAGQEYLFVQLFSRVHHVSTWAVLPWLVWIWLQALSRRDGTRWLVCGALALFVVAFSDMAVGAWFAAPALVAWPLGRALGGRCPDYMEDFWRKVFVYGVRYAIPLASVMVLAKLASDPVLFESHQLQFSFATVASSLGNLAGYLAYAAIDSPLMLPLWLGLVAVVVWWPLARARHWWDGGRFVAVADNGRRRMRCVLALWVPGAVLVPVLANVVTGLAVTPTDIGRWSFELRTLLPTVWLPLFVGWALLPWRAPRSWVVGAGGALAACCLAYIMVARPAWRNLDPFATEFHECFAAHAVARNLVGGVGGREFLLVLADPTLPLQRFVPLNQKGLDSSFFVLANTNADWFRGAVDFVVINDSATGRQPLPPLDHQSNTCVASAWTGCSRETMDVLLEAYTFALAGPVAETVECAGVRFAFPVNPLVYDLRV